MLLLLLKRKMGEPIECFAYCILCEILVQEEYSSTELCVVLLKILKIRMIRILHYL